MAGQSERRPAPAAPRSAAVSLNVELRRRIAGAIRRRAAPASQNRETGRSVATGVRAEATITRRADARGPVAHFLEQMRTLDPQEAAPSCSTETVSREWVALLFRSPGRLSPHAPNPDAIIRRSAVPFHV
jgi:hypothetical protein